MTVTEEFNINESISELLALIDNLDAKIDSVQAKLDLTHASLEARLDELTEKLNVESTVEVNPNVHI